MRHPLFRQAQASFGFMLLVVASVVLGCDDDDGPASGVCGDDVVNAGEDCDGTAGCLADCTMACGNGVVDADETCDTAIAAGSTGACLTTCENTDPCKTYTLQESACQTACVEGLIIAPIKGDGCCQPGVYSFDDDDCSTACGNGVVEAGEKCDTAIESSNFACPADAGDCDDGVGCTTDAPTQTGTCAAECMHTEVTALVAGDGCCPAGGQGTDSDCSANCGNGIVDADETCEAVPTDGTTPCPAVTADCDDTNACTTDSVVSAGTCNATCAHQAIVAPVNGDGCCPDGAHAGIDDDCVAACGNGVVEGTEECDDGNTTAGDGCDASCARDGTPTAFRINEISLKDPHFFMSSGSSCVDLATLLGTFLSGALTGDTNHDGTLDTSLMLIFRPLNQSASSTTFELRQGSCTAPIASTSCGPIAGSPAYATTATNRTSGSCGEVIAGTTSYTPAPTVPSAGAAGCFESAQVDIDVPMGMLSLTLRETQIAGAYSGNPATELLNGLLRGFLSEADAGAITLPTDIPLPALAGKTLASLLAGGAGTCAPGDARDTLADGTRGWYFYLNFKAKAVPYTE